MNKKLKCAKWMAFDVSLVVVGTDKVIFLTD